MSFDKITAYRKFFSLIATFSLLVNSFFTPALVIAQELTTPEPTPVVEETSVPEVTEEPVVEEVKEPVEAQETEVAVALSNVTPQFEDVDSMVRLQSTNGHGATNTKIRRFSNVVEIRGASIGYKDSATDGASFTIKESGVYS